VWNVKTNFSGSEVFVVFFLLLCPLLLLSKQGSNFKRMVREQQQAKYIRTFVCNINSFLMLTRGRVPINTLGMG